MNLLKLNLGCSFQKIPGFVNIDKEAVCEPDKVVDLEQTPWPFEDNSVGEILASHILEHLGQEPKVFLGIIKEMYRVCVDGAQIRVLAPHHDHWSFHSDPTHVRKIHPKTFELFDQEINRLRVQGGYSDTPLGLMYDVDFVTENVEPKFDEPWASRIENNLIASYDLNFAASHYTNAILQWNILLRVRKKGNG